MHQAARAREEPARQEVRSASARARRHDRLLRAAEAIDPNLLDELADHLDAVGGLAGRTTGADPCRLRKWAGMLRGPEGS